MTEIAKIIGEESVRVLKRDGSSVDVKVLALPLSKMDRWLNAQEDEVLLIQVATGLTAEDLESITPESQEQILAKAEELNAAFFARFVARRVQRSQKLESYAANAKRPSE